MAAELADPYEAFPKPDLQDILTFKQRQDRVRASWVERVNRVRDLRYQEDELPQKWHEQLNIPDGRRFFTNSTDNQITRISTLLNRNPPKVYVPASGIGDKAQDRSTIQTRWGQELPNAFERDSLLPIWDRVDDSACETGIGIVEEFFTDEYDRWQELAEEYKTAKPADKRDIERELAAMGLPVGVRVPDAVSVSFEVDGNGRCWRVQIAERKNYRQVFNALREGMSAEDFAEASIPPISALGTPQIGIWNFRYGDGESVYNATPDEEGMVDVIRQYDDKWLTVVVAGRIVQNEPHGFPRVPVFLQFGRVTSSSYQGRMLRGVTFGTAQQELIANDIGTLWTDNQFTYSRPFPIIETSENGAPIMDPKTNMPRNVDLSDPTQPPVLGPGQKVADAFGDFHGNVDTNFLTFISGYMQQSGLGAIAQGESPGADASGYAIASLTEGATGPFAPLLRGKQKMLANFINFNRQLVRDVLEGPVTLAIESEDGNRSDYVTLTPERVDDVPTKVTIDPQSDAQRMGITQWIVKAWQDGLVPKSVAQRVAYGNVIDDQTTVDDQILLERAKTAMEPMIVEAAFKALQRDAFPETAVTPAGPPAPDAPTAPPGPSAPSAPTIGATMSAASRATGPSASQSVASAAPGGQQPPQQGVPDVSR